MNFLRNKWKSFRGKRKYPWLYRREDLLEDNISFSELYDDEFKENLTTLVGEWINREYFLLSLLGRGTFSIVYLAYSLQERDIVVIKMILPCYKMEGKYERDILETLYNSIEGFPYQIFKWVKHPNIICIKQPSLGISIYDLIQKNSYKKLHIDTIITYFHDCLSHLNKIHNSNVVHCDLKPDNILTTIENSYNYRLKKWFLSLKPNKYIHDMAWGYKRDGEYSILRKRKWSEYVKLAQKDFSLHFKNKFELFERTINDEKINELENVKEIEDFDLYSSDSLEAVDITNNIHIEKPHHAFIIDFGNSLLMDDIKPSDICFESYRPPENIINMNISKKTDVWSLGCIFYEMLTDKNLFTLGNYNESYEENNNILIENRESIGQISFDSVDTLDYIDEQRLTKMYKLCNLDDTIRKNNMKELLQLNSIFTIDNTVLDLITEVISDMLQIDVEQRPNCSVLLNYKLFKPFIYDTLTEMDI